MASSRRLQAILLPSYEKSAVSRKVLYHVSHLMILCPEVEDFCHPCCTEAVVLRNLAQNQISFHSEILNEATTLDLSIWAVTDTFGKTMTGMVREGVIVQHDTGHSALLACLTLSA